MLLIGEKRPDGFIYASSMRNSFINYLIIIFGGK